MRTHATDAETRLWKILRAKWLAGYKFKRQVPIDHYIVDFVCLRHRLIVEADGGQHGSAADAKRDAYFRAQNFRILRFWNNDILINQEGVTLSILNALEAPLPNPVRGQVRPPDKPKSPRTPAKGRGAIGVSNG